MGYGKINQSLHRTSVFETFVHYNTPPRISRRRLIAAIKVRIVSIVHRRTDGRGSCGGRQASSVNARNSPESARRSENQNHRGSGENMLAIRGLRKTIA